MLGALVAIFRVQDKSLQVIGKYGFYAGPRKYVTVTSAQDAPLSTLTCARHRKMEDGEASAPDNHLSDRGSAEFALHITLTASPINTDNLVKAHKLGASVQLYCTCCVAGDGTLIRMRREKSGVRPAVLARSSIWERVLSSASGRRMSSAPRS